MSLVPGLVLQKKFPVPDVKSDPVLGNPSQNCRLTASQPLISPLVSPHFFQKPQFSLGSVLKTENLVPVWFLLTGTRTNGSNKCWPVIENQPNYQ